MEKPQKFCWVPFFEQYIRTDGRFSLCCEVPKVQIHQENGVLFLAGRETMAEVWESKAMDKLRQQFIREAPPVECRACYDVECVGGKSKRMHVTEEVEKLFPDAVRSFDEQLAFFVDKNQKALPPRIMDVRLGNHCNLSCRPCNSRQSSRFHEEVGALIASGREVLSDLEDQYYEVETNFIGARVDKKLFWEELHGRVPQLYRVNFAGGEPLFHRSLHQFVQDCRRKGKTSKLGLKFITNLTYLEKSMLDALEVFRYCTFSCSLDGFGTFNEYLRYPSKWETLDRNLRLLLQRSPKKFGYKVYITVSAYNIFGMKELLCYLKKVAEEYQRSLRIYFSIVHSPEYLDLEIVPIEWRKKVACEIGEVVHDFIAHKEAHREIHALLRLLVKQTYSEERLKTLREKFREHVQLFDEGRSANLLEHVPELAELIRGDGDNYR